VICYYNDGSFNLLIYDTLLDIDEGCIYSKQTPKKMLQHNIKRIKFGVIIATCIIFIHEPLNRMPIKIFRKIKKGK